MTVDVFGYAPHRIEDEEEWDKYIIPSKVESEKYKVSRTFSFLKSRMSSTRNKTKVSSGAERAFPPHPRGTAEGSVLSRVPKDFTQTLFTHVAFLGRLSHCSRVQGLLFGGEGQIPCP